MRGEVLTAWAQAARNRYELLLTGFRDALARLLAEGERPGTERLRTRLQDDLYDLSAAWLAEEAEAMARDIRAMGHDGVVETDRAVDTPESAIPDTSEDLDEVISEHLDLLVQELDLTLRLQVERDVGAVMRSLRSMALTGALRERRGGAAASRGGAGAADAQNALAALSFDFLDRSGKRWTSTRHVGVLWRHALVLAWNECALLRAARIGLADLQVEHPDPSFGELGTLVSTSGEESETGVAWSEIRDETFHPNSVAWLRPVDAAISQP